MCSCPNNNKYLILKSSLIQVVIFYISKPTYCEDLSDKILLLWVNSASLWRLYTIAQLMWDISESGQRPKMMTNDIHKIKEFFECPATFVFLTPKNVLPQSPLMALRQLWTLQHGCRTLTQARTSAGVLFKISLAVSFTSSLPHLSIFPWRHLFVLILGGLCPWYPITQHGS